MVGVTANVIRRSASAAPSGIRLTTGLVRPGTTSEVVLGSGVATKQIGNRGGRDYSFVARYGEILPRGGIAAIPSALFRYQGKLQLTPQQVWFISAILSHKWDAEMPHPSLKRLAADTGMSERHLHNIKKQLVESRWLTLVPRETPHGGQDTNYYDFGPLFREMEKLLQSEMPSTETNVSGGKAGQEACTIAPTLTAGPMIPGSASRLKQGSATPVKSGSAHEEPLLENHPKTQNQQQTTAAPAQRPGNDDVVVAALTEQGITETVARQLVRDFPHDLILAQIDMLEYRKLDTNRAGALVKAIRESWAAPEGYVPAGEQERRELDEWEVERAWRWQLEREQSLQDQEVIQRWRASVCASRDIEPGVVDFWEYTREEWLPRLLGRRLADKYFCDTLLEIDRGRATVWFRTLEAERTARAEVPEVVRSALRLWLGRDIPVEYKHWIGTDPVDDSLASRSIGKHDRPGRADAEVANIEPFEGRGVGAKQAWAVAVMELEALAGTEHYLRGSRLLGHEGDELLVGVATTYAAQWLGRRAAARAAEVLSALAGKRVGVRFVPEVRQVAVAT